MHRKFIIAGLVAASCVSSSWAGKDKFNRADLGRKWVVTAGAMYLDNQHLAGDSGSLAYYTKSSQAETAAINVVLNGSGDVEYGAIALGDIAGGNNAFIKIQSQNGLGTFDTAGFYIGNNGGGSFFTLDGGSGVSAARMSATLSGSVATLVISDLQGNVLGSYEYDYGTTFGTGGGLGTYGMVGLDNYRSHAITEQLRSVPRRVTASNALDRSR